MEGNGCKDTDGHVIDGQIGVSTAVKADIILLLHMSKYGGFGWEIKFDIAESVKHPDKVGSEGGAGHTRSLSD